MIRTAPDPSALLYRCAGELLEIIPLLRGRINAHIHAEVSRAQRVTPGQTRMLYLVGQGIATIRDLSTRQQTSPPTVSRQADSLVEKGLLQRERSAADRRSVVLRLTPQGEQVLAEIMNSTRHWIAAELACLAPARVERLLQAFTDLRVTFAPSTGADPTPPEEA